MTFSTVLVSDYMEYLEGQIAAYGAKITANKNAKAAAIAEYKSLPWYRKILAYNPESSGVFDYESDLIWIYCRNINDLKKEMARAEYTNIKIGKFMNIDSKNDFWNWK